MFIPLTIALLPHLIHFAESEIKGGEHKKAFVMGSVSKTYDSLKARGLIPDWLDKDIALDIISILIDEIVPLITNTVGKLTGKVNNLIDKENDHV